MGEPHKILAMIEDHVGSVEKNETAFILSKAAACIREMVEKIAMLEDELEVANLMVPPSVSSGAGPRCNKVLAGLGKPYPRTCLVCRLGPCRDEIIPHNLPPAPGAEA